MFGLIERLALPFLALCWIGVIAVMAWIALRPKARDNDSDGDRGGGPKAAPIAPRGPMTAAQLTALNRRRRLAR